MESVMLDLRAAARALDGEVSGRDSIICPGPGHRRKDRSLSVRFPSGGKVLVNSFAGDDWRDCLGYVEMRLGLDRGRASRRATEARRRASEPRLAEGDQITGALSLWHVGMDPRGALAEVYLRGRGLDIGDDLAGDVLRWHRRSRAMVALFRNIYSDEPQAVSRTFLDCAGTKIERKFLGPVGGAAVKLDPDENVLTGLHVGEGVETCLAARQFGLRPAWALGSKGAIRDFPVLSGIEALTIFAEPDAEREVETCAPVGTPQAGKCSSTVRSAERT